MIIIRLWGGLGNQLFQYSFGQYIEKEIGIKIFYDISSFGSSDQLRKLEIYSLIPNLSVRNAHFTKYTGIKNRLFRVLFQLKNTYLSESKFKLESLKENKETIFLQGYWQNTLYAKYLPAKRILQEWKTPDVLQSIENIIITSRTPISLHVRRGDYFSKKHIHTYGVCTEEYYKQAIEKIESKVLGEKLYFVFSDDISWVKKNIPLPQSTIFVPNYDICQFSYIYLMSLCKTNIISNSTFSWWGAYLNQNENQLVIAPSRWTLTSNKTITLDNWIKI